jgi:predicted RNA binding protein YcfA (HicA-like mRNA interferase family)
MTQIEKLWNDIKNSPQKVTFEDLDKLLQRAGFTKKEPHGGSSHYTYKKGSKRLTVPKKTPYLSKEYVEQAIELLKGESV